MRGRFIAAGLAILLLPCAVSVGAEQQRKEPLPVVQFGIQIEGLDPSACYFKSVSGLESVTQVAEYRDGGSEEEVRKRPGQTKYSNIVLKRGFMGEDTKDPIQQWVRDVYTGKQIQRNVTLTYYRKDLTEAARYTFFRCFPVRWAISEVDASTNEMAIETIEITHEAVTRSSP